MTSSCQVLQAGQFPVASDQPLASMLANLDGQDPYRMTAAQFVAFESELIALANASAKRALEVSSRRSIKGV